MMPIGVYSSLRVNVIHDHRVRQVIQAIRERGSVLYLGMALECWDFAKLAIA